MEPQLVFSPIFGERSLAEQIDYLKKLCSSQNHALDLMQKERNALRVEVDLMKVQVQNAQTAYEIQKNVTRDLIVQSNADGQGVAERIHQLEAKVKELSHGR